MAMGLKDYSEAGVEKCLNHLHLCHCGSGGQFQRCQYP